MARDLGHDNPQTTLTTDSSHMQPSIPDCWRIFAYVLDGSQLVVGCCVAELLTPALINSHGYQVRRLSGGRRSLLSWRLLSQDETDHPQSPSPPSTQHGMTRVPLPLCGVRRLWVCARYRREGVATRLLTCVLSNLICGRPLSRSQVAFAEPTACGADFAVAFTGQEDFITYWLFTPCAFEYIFWKILTLPQYTPFLLVTCSCVVTLFAVTALNIITFKQTEASNRNGEAGWGHLRRWSLWKCWLNTTSILSGVHLDCTSYRVPQSVWLKTLLAVHQTALNPSANVFLWITESNLPSYFIYTVCTYSINDITIRGFLNLNGERD